MFLLAVSLGIGVTVAIARRYTAMPHPPKRVVPPEAVRGTPKPTAEILQLSIVCVISAQQKRHEYT